MGGIQDIRIHAPLVIAAGACFIAIDSLMVTLRIYARYLTKTRLGADDYLCLTALLFVIGMGITLIIETSIKGFGYPAVDGDSGVGRPDSNVAGWPTELIQIPALASIKLSFLFLYRRIFDKHGAPRFQWLVWTMIALVVSWAISYFFLILFLCGTNFAAYWTSSYTEKTECLPTAPVHLSYAITDVITDIFVIGLPIPMVWQLHMSTKRKFGVTAVFGLGAITCAMSIIRLAIYDRALTVQFDPDSDFEYITTLTSYFSTLEIGLGLIAACLPVQYGLLKSDQVEHIMRSIHSLTSLSSRESGNRERGTVTATQTALQTNATPDAAKIYGTRKAESSSSRDDTEFGDQGLVHQGPQDGSTAVNTHREDYEQV